MTEHPELDSTELDSTEFDPIEFDPTDEPTAAEWSNPALSEWWQREFTDGADLEYTEQILPLILDELRGFPVILDVGTGEGQVARALTETGSRVIGIDPFPAQTAEASRRGGGPSYALAGAAAIPLADDSVDAVVACLVFEHIDDVDEAIAEVARVLRPGGRFLFLLNHPLLQTPGSGWIDDQILDPPEQYWRIGPYLIEQSTVEQVQRDVWVRFVHRPLSRYLNTLIAHGLSLAYMHEPAPPAEFLAQAPDFVDGATVPRLLALRLHKTGGIV
ncbi:MAG: class I SAM-dependent methyltransferase [Actinomycetota bacterium]|nr:class I SAM-dependent methyltransferase [Actinomycetota bacterium]